MLEYPSIETKGRMGEPCYVFHKYDGSNLRAEWSNKKGWHKFGTRTRLMDETDLQFPDAIELWWKILDGVFADFYPLMQKKNIKDVTVFGEYFGSNSFAGVHVEESHQIKVFDVAINKVFVAPKLFVEHIAGHYAPQHYGITNFNQSLIDSVKNGSFDTSLSEGVVCKGNTKNGVWRAKIKTLDWLTKLKERYEDWEKYV